MREYIDLVDVGSSDDECGVGTIKAPPTLPNPSYLQPTQRPELNLKPKSSDVNHISQSRSFWKAGDFDVAATSKSTTLQVGHLEHARVHPKFLHTNATSHKWAFGAIAELLDNAVDEICNGATFVKVDRIYNAKDNSPALLFHDDGGGMDTESLRKCMSLGYSSKKSNSTIGQYGNGFKTSTMRLGADAIVFSRATRPGHATQSIGLLSYTFLRTTGKDDVIVPMIDFDISIHCPEPIIYSSWDDWSSNLKTILEWSPFSSKEDLMMQFEDMGQHGTKVIIYNLWLNDEGIFELSFDDDEEDICLRDESKQTFRTKKIQPHLSHRLRYSLRAYTSILYLQKFTNFHIILRGKPVQWLNFVDELKFSKTVVYRPQIAGSSKEGYVEITLGFDPDVSISGFNVYNRNRLIRPFWRITRDGSSVGNSVFGILEANFIEPAHDKQDFERSSMFLRLEKKLKQIQMEYWKTSGHLVGFTIPNSRGPKGNNPVAEEAVVGLASSNSEPDKIGPEINESDPIDVELTEPRAAMESDFASGRSSSRTSSMDICGDNIQLWMRCEEQIQKKNELKLLVEKLEKEVEEAKTNCAHLSSLIQLRKTHHNG